MHVTHKRLCTWIMNMDLNLLKVLLLLSFWSSAGETTALKQHYRRKNSSFCLQVHKSPPYDVSLVFGDNSVIHNNKTSQAYKHRVDYNQKTQKWCLHQLNETDSGTYKFQVMKNDKFTAYLHKLLVEEAVPRPVIGMSVSRSNLSAESCTITVNCSVWESWVSSVCNESLCQTSGQSLKSVNITVSAGNRAVICIGSNNVSMSNVSEAICSSGGPETPDEKPVYVGLACLLAIFLLLCAAILCVVCIRDQRDTRPPRKIQPAEGARAPSVSSRVSNVSSQSEVAYENVDATTSGQDCGVGTTNHLVDGPQGALGGSEASKAKHPGEVETVYSVLHKVHTVQKTPAS